LIISLKKMTEAHNEFIPASNGYPACIYTHLPEIPAAYKSRTVPLETLINMSKRENDLRVFDENYQQLFKLRHSSNHEELVRRLAAVREALGLKTPHDPTTSDIIETLQIQVLSEFGYTPKNVSALYELRTAAMQFPEVEDFQRTVFFRYNRSGLGIFRVGERGSDCALYSPDSLEKTSLHEVLKKHCVESLNNDPYRRFSHHPCVVVSGSYT
jgi:hypothetical protein